MKHIRIASERTKYQTCYRDPVYRMGENRKGRAFEDIASMQPGDRYLDVGCGRGETVNAAADRGVDAWGLELVPDLCGGRIVEGEITAIPFGDRSFDCVSCYDVLEHLPTDQIDAALDELFRVSRSVVLISTNDKPSFYKGLELHLTRKPREWWDRKLSERSSVSIGTVFGRNEWHWKCTIE